MAFLVILGMFVLVGLGVRSFVRITRRARARNLLEQGFADSPKNAFTVYGYAFSRAGFSLDTVLMVLGFAGQFVWLWFGFTYLIR